MNDFIPFITHFSPNYSRFGIILTFEGIGDHGAEKCGKEAKKHGIGKSVKTESFGVRQISNLAPPSQLFENVPAFYQFSAAKEGV